MCQLFPRVYYYGFHLKTGHSWTQDKITVINITSMKILQAEIWHLHYFSENNIRIQKVCCCHLETFGKKIFQWTRVLTKYLKNIYTSWWRRPKVFTENNIVVLDSMNSIQAHTLFKSYKGKYWARLIHRPILVPLNNTQNSIP